MPAPPSKTSPLVVGLAPPLQLSELGHDLDVEMEANHDFFIEANGEQINIDAFNIPDNVKEVLQEMDFGQRGSLSRENVDEAIQLVRMLKRVFDTDYMEDEGKMGRKSCHVVTKIEMKEGLDLLLKLKTAKVANASTMSYAHLPEQIQEVVRLWDMDGSGEIGISELSMAAKAYKQVQNEKRTIKRIAVGMALIIALLLAGIFAVTYFVVDMSKEMRGDQSGIMKTPDGHFVKVGSSDFVVNADGKLTVRGDESRRLEGCANNSDMCDMAPVLKVEVAKEQRQLSSAIPDKLFAEMSQLTLSGADGVSKFTIWVQGFTRVVVASKCGSLVHIFSILGSMTLDDTDMYFDEDLSNKMTSYGFRLDGVTGYGRRLISNSQILGIFSFFDNYDWQCTSVEPPKSVTKPFVYTAIKSSPCLATTQCTSAIFKDGTLRPGTISNDGSDLAIITEETVVETDEFSLSIKKFPNHPLQSIVMITDHVNQTRRSMQVFNGTAHHCSSWSYGVSDPTNMSDYFPVFVGMKVERGRTIGFPWRVASVPERQVRAFRLEPKQDIPALPVSIDYDVDANTGVPTRLFILKARDWMIDVEEIIFESLQEDASVVAGELLRKFAFSCDSAYAERVPEITNPFTENEADVGFYLRRYLNIPKDDPLVAAMSESAYWKELYNVPARLLVEEDDQPLESVSSYDNQSGRGLGVDGGFEAKFPIDPTQTLAFSIKTGDGVCSSISKEGSRSASSPWTLGGSVTWCTGPPSSLEGSVSITYGANIEKRFGQLECKLGASATGTLALSSYDYPSIYDVSVSFGITLEAGCAYYTWWGSKIDLVSLKGTGSLNAKFGPLGTRRRYSSPRPEAKILWFTISYEYESPPIGPIFLDKR
jgi:hypothetical protein